MEPRICSENVDRISSRRRQAILGARCWRRCRPHVAFSLVPTCPRQGRNGADRDLQYFSPLCAEDARSAKRAASPGWRSTPERIRLLVSKNTIALLQHGPAARKRSGRFRIGVSRWGRSNGAGSSLAEATVTRICAFSQRLLHRMRTPQCRSQHGRGIVGVLSQRFSGPSSSGFPAIILASCMFRTQSAD